MQMLIDTAGLAYPMLVARILIASVFLVSGIHKALYYQKAKAEFQRENIPFIKVTLPATITLHIMASVCIIAGWHTGEAAFALVAFTALASLKVHAFWRLPREEQLGRSRIFFANVSIIGGLLLLGSVGPGPLSILDSQTFFIDN